MELARPSHSKYLLVCENERGDGACCAPEGTAIREALKKRVKEMGLDRRIRVSRSGCLDICAEGPNVLLMPDGVWFKRVRREDIEAIIQKTTEEMS